MASKKSSKKKSSKIKRIKTKKSQKHVLESSKAIENLYEQERQRIDDSVKALERDRLNSYIILIDKRKGLLNLKRKKLDELEKNLVKHMKEVDKEIVKLKRQKNKEKAHFDRMYHLNEHLKNMEIQVRDIAVSRKTLIAKEKQLLDATKQFFKTNKKDLKEYGYDDRVNKIKGIIDMKTKILSETIHLLDEDIRTIFSDKRVLESATDAQLKKVNKINQKLQGLNTEHSNLLKKIQSTQTEGFDFDQEFRILEEKRDALAKELKKLGFKTK